MIRDREQAREGRLCIAFGHACWAKAVLKLLRADGKLGRHSIKQGLRLNGIAMRRKRDSGCLHILAGQRVFP